MSIYKIFVSPVFSILWMVTTLFMVGEAQSVTVCCLVFLDTGQQRLETTSLFNSRFFDVVKVWVLNAFMFRNEYKQYS